MAFNVYIHIQPEKVYNKSSEQASSWCSSLALGISQVGSVSRGVALIRGSPMGLNT